MLKPPRLRIFVSVLLAASLSGLAGMARAYQPYGYQNTPVAYPQQFPETGTQGQTPVGGLDHIDPVRSVLHRPARAQLLALKPPAFVSPIALD